MSRYRIMTTVRPQAPRMAFIGVTTARSAIVPIFPRWSRALGLEGATLIGRDVPLRAPRETHRGVLADLLADPGMCGALVTTHKVDLFEAAQDMFDEIEPLARLCGEVSCVARRDGRVVGMARDPITVGRALDDLLGPDPISGHVLCLGAGGAGCALAVHLAESRRSERVVLVDREPDRLRAVADVMDRMGGALPAVELVHSAGEAENDRLVEALPPASLIVNATGMGKDLPGSPLGDRCRLPERAIAWDFNYRGDLRFLGQAGSQSDRGVRAAGGWDYFLHGWSDHMAQVFGVAWTEALFRRLRSLAQEVRP